MRLVPNATSYAYTRSRVRNAALDRKCGRIAHYARAHPRTRIALEIATVRAYVLARARPVRSVRFHLPNQSLRPFKMPKTGRTRIDYIPGAAALEALDITAQRFPHIRPQALLGKLETRRGVACTAAGGLHEGQSGMSKMLRFHGELIEQCVEGLH